ncbi:ergothioneine biosynthesis protein EgtB [bacterium AH-315-F03]|nr:ergothioneine biosynthesis protein EgtB [bacterium AH-315-F03]
MTQSSETIQTTLSREAALDAYVAVRRQSEKLAEPLCAEDTAIQPIPDVSPTKWHLGHMSWFFEQVILCKFLSNYQPSHPDFFFIHNSYYDSFGQRVERTKRGTLSRPTLAEIMNYRREIDERMCEFLTGVSENLWDEVTNLLQIGINHEQQHQELLLTDIKYVLAENPLHPVYRNTLPNVSSAPSAPSATIPQITFLSFSGGLMEIGADENDTKRFSYDIEGPRHKIYLNDFKLASRPVSCGEFLEFINDGGYDNPLLWLSDGWAAKEEQHWSAPLYWKRSENQWHIMTLSGLRELNESEPVCHVSYYEAWAFARWAGKRLPTEAEWEIASAIAESDLARCNLVEAELFHPRIFNAEDYSENSGTKLKRMIGDVWEWTASAYLPYPGYTQITGPLGEYNGKFMSGQMVLRGGSCATPQSHIRNTYRNFFQYDKRWQFSGFRLAQDS